jgi:hypothetical protein
MRVNPTGSGRLVYDYGDGVSGTIYRVNSVNVLYNVMQMFEDYKSSGIYGSDVYVDGIGPLAVTALTGAGVVDSSGVAVRMLYGRFGDGTGLLTGRQLMFVVYDANKVSDRVGMTSSINSILGTSW